MKIGSGYLFIQNGETKCVNDQSQATKLAFSPSQSESGLIESISVKASSGSLKYNNKGSFTKTATNLKFRYSLEGGNIISKLNKEHRQKGNT